MCDLAQWLGCQITKQQNQAQTLRPAFLKIFVLPDFSGKWRKIQVAFRDVPEFCSPFAV